MYRVRRTFWRSVLNALGRSRFFACFWHYWIFATLPKLKISGGNIVYRLTHGSVYLNEFLTCFTVWKQVNKFCKKGCCCRVPTKCITKNLIILEGVNTPYSKLSRNPFVVLVQALTRLNFLNHCNFSSPKTCFIVRFN